MPKKRDNVSVSGDLGQNHPGPICSSAPAPNQTYTLPIILTKFQISCQFSVSDLINIYSTSFGIYIFFWFGEYVALYKDE
jgi:hypothetical protein